MKIYKTAAIATAIILAVLVGIFYSWKKGIETGPGVSKISAINKMESEGVPDFQSQTLGGKQINLRNVQASIVIVHFWASWCGPCVEEIPSIVKLVDEMQGQVKVIAVSGDSSDEDVNKFLKSFPEMKHQDIHIIVDKSQEISKMYDVDRLPESFILNRNFKLIKKIVGSTNWHTPDSIKFLKSKIEGVN